MRPAQPYSHGDRNLAVNAPICLIDEAQANDLVAIGAIFNHAILHSTAIWYDRVKTDDEMSAWMSDKRRSGLPVLVARGEGYVRGFATYGPFRPQHGYRETAEHSVYVDRNYRRKGIARALMDALIERAKAAGLHVLVGAIAADNIEGIALHKTLGFVETGRMPDVGLKFGRRHTLVFMQRIL